MIRDELQSICAAAFGAWSPQLGVTAQEIEAAEQRLGITLPEPLRDFHLTCGRQPQMLDADFHFTPLEQLKLEDDALFFCAENQQTVAWAVLAADLALPDPKVKYRRPGKPGKWFLDTRSCASFILNNACWQGVMALPESAWFEIMDDRLPRLEEHLRPLGDEQIRQRYTKRSFIDPERRLLAVYLGVADRCYIGGPDVESLESFEERSGFELDWL